ncbi:ERF family protein [Patescibacteria group bacterium]|nr:ERF family protein [Patescibacteria group bacterium]
MSETAVQRQPTGMEILADLARSNRDPQAAIEIARQITELQIAQEKLRQEQDRFDWEKQDRDARVAFAEAFYKFKENAPKILKTKHVKIEKRDGTPGPDYWHVELDKACDLLIPALLKVGITHRWVSEDLPNGYVRVTCYLKHRLGFEEKGATLAGPQDQSGGKNPIQGVGSSKSYLERYTFLGSCGLVPEGKDDDGAGGGIVQEEADKHLKAISEATEPKSVMEAWVKAVEAAKALDPIDFKSITIFTEARDERLKELKRAK